MATKFVDFVKGVAVSVSWSAIALFLDGLFWRLLFIVGDFFIYLGNLLHSFGAIARGPPQVPPDGSARKAREGSPEGSDVHARRPQPPPVANVADVKCSKVGEGSDDARRPQPAPVGMRPDVNCSNVGHEGAQDRDHSHPNIKHRRDPVTNFGVTSNQVFREYLDEKIPEFLCNVSCHRRWSKWYAIVKGRQPGLYNCWNCADDMVTEFTGNSHKSFRHKLEAETFLKREWHCIRNHSVYS